MKKLILDEMNIKDIMNPIDLNEALYPTPTTPPTTTNIIEVVYDDETFIDLSEITVPDPDPEDEPETEPEGIDMFNNDYIVIAKTDNKMYLKKIPINVPEEDPII